MSDQLWGYIIIGLPLIITSLATAYASIRSANAATRAASISAQNLVVSQSNRVALSEATQAISQVSLHTNGMVGKLEALAESRGQEKERQRQENIMPGTSSGTGDPPTGTA